MKIMENTNIEEIDLNELNKEIEQEIQLNNEFEEIETLEVRNRTTQIDSFTSLYETNLFILNSLLTKINSIDKNFGGTLKRDLLKAGESLKRKSLNLVEIDENFEVNLSDFQHRVFLSIIGIETKLLEEICIFNNEELVKLFHKTKDERLKLFLLYKNFPLIMWYSTKRGAKGSGFIEGTTEDLVQEVIIGFMKGIERFDVEKENKFSTFIYFYLQYGNNSYKQSYTKDFKLPINYQEEFTKVKIILDKEFENLQDTPTYYEILETILAKAEKMTRNKVVEFSEMYYLLTKSESSSFSTSLSEELGVSGDNDDGSKLEIVQIAHLDGTIDGGETLRKENEKAVTELVGELFMRSKKPQNFMLVVYYQLTDLFGSENLRRMYRRYSGKKFSSKFESLFDKNGDKVTLEEIGQTLGLTRERVRQLIKIATEELIAISKTKNLDFNL